MPWLFTYGISTDAERMKREVGTWEALQPATLSDHVYLFTGHHAEFGGAISTILPMRGGTVLGVAYRLSDSQMQEMQKHWTDFDLRPCTVTSQEQKLEAICLLPREHAAPNRPAASYVEELRRALTRHYPEKLVDLYLNRAIKRSSVEELAPCKLPTPESFTDEYGCDFRRLYPWQKAAATPFGSAWAIVEPGKESLPHCHDEEETFVFLKGDGLISVDGHEFRVGPGDAVYLQAFSAHFVRNIGESPLEFLCIWWGGAAA